MVSIQNARQKQLASEILTELLSQAGRRVNLFSNDFWPRYTDQYSSISCFDDLFIETVDWLRDERCLEHDGFAIGPSNDTWLLDAKAIGPARTTLLLLQSEATMAEQISPARLREVRDMILRYLYENAAGNYSFALPAGKISSALGITHQELSGATTLLINQGLFGSHGVAIGEIGINERGQAEAERLGPSVMLREQSSPGSVTIHANYSVVQVAGSGSTQTASLEIDQSSIESILNEIERELPSLPLEEPAKEQARGLLASLRGGMASKIGLAGLRAIGAALSSILTGAGSVLGKSLAVSLAIAL